MGKVLFWLFVIFAILFALRLFNASKAKRRARDDAARAGGKKATPATMVRCVCCGVFLPQLDAKQGPSGYLCGDPACIARR